MIPTSSHLFFVYKINMHQPIKTKTTKGMAYVHREKESNMHLRKVI